MKRFTLFFALFTMIVLLTGCFAQRTYRFMYDSDHISAVYIVISDGSTEESVEVNPAVLEEVANLYREYSYPPCPNLSNPYIRVIYENGDEEWISKDCAYRVSNGREVLRSGQYNAEAFCNLINSYLNGCWDKTRYSINDFDEIIAGESTYYDICIISPKKSMVVTSYGGYCDFPTETGGSIRISFYGPEMVVWKIEEISPNASAV